MKTLDTWSNDSVKVTLVEDNGNYKIVRRDGKYSYVNNLGKVTHDKARHEFSLMCQG